MRTPIIILLLSFLVACGTTSGIKSGDSGSKQVDLSAYNLVTIGDFSDSTKKQNLPSTANTYFGDLILTAIKSRGIFDKVTKGSVDGQSIAISGEITRYVEGNAALKALVGFGAGSTYFNATVTFHNSVTGELLGKIYVDKNSWGGGGFIAAGQTIESFMKAAADKVAKELEKSKAYQAKDADVVK